MINYLDIAVLLTVVLSIFFGFKKGFLKTFTGLVAILLSLIVAITFYPHVAEWITETSVYDVVYDNTASVIKEPEEEADNISDYGTGKLSLPKNFMKYLEKNIDTATEAVADTISTYVASAAVKLVSILLIFIVSRLVILFLTSIAGLIRKLPIIGWSDSLLGGLFGFFRGLILVYIVLAFVTFAASVKPDGIFSNEIKYSKFAKLAYNNNVIMDFVYKN